jgi:uncharacterized protein with HEPN domain
MKSDSVYLHHILDAIKRIEEYTEKIDHERFINTNLLQDGVIRQIQIIGEAAKRLSPKITNKYKDIPWKDITGMRDKLVHDYFGVDVEAVWKTVKNDIPFLKNQINNISKEIL